MSQPTHVRRVLRGFTLIELLIVVIIIAILASIALPKFPANKATAHAAAVRYNLRELQDAQELYFEKANKYSADLPPSFKPSSGIEVAVDAASPTGWRGTAVGPTGVVCHIAVGDAVPAGETDAVPYCDPGEAVLSEPRPLTALDSIISRLPVTGVAYDAPSEMTLHQPVNLVLVLDPRQVPALPRLYKTLSQRQTDSIIGTLVAAGSTDSIPHETAVVHYSPRMRAELRGQSFNITSRTPDEQGVGATGPTIWRWEVTPNETEEHVLSLTISAIVSLAGHDVPKVYPVLDRRIRVRTAWGRAIKATLADHWEWFVGTLLLAPLTWLFKEWWARKKTPAA